MQITIPLATLVARFEQYISFNTQSNESSTSCPSTSGQLSFMGLPCPNIFSGGLNFHGKYEYLPLRSLQKATATIVALAIMAGTK